MGSSLTNEAVRALVEVSWARVHAGAGLPGYLLADLRDGALCDDVAQPLRDQCRRLLRIGEGEAA